MKFFDFGAFQKIEKMSSHDEILFHMLFWAFHDTSCIKSRELSQKYPTELIHLHAESLRNESSSLALVLIFLISVIVLLPQLEFLKFSTTESFSLNTILFQLYTCNKTLLWSQTREIKETRITKKEKPIKNA